MEHEVNKSVADMIIAASNYCRFVESIESIPKDEIPVYLLKLLPVLYVKGLLIPNTEKDSDEIVEHFVTEETYEKILISVKNAFKGHEFYFDTDDTEKFIEKRYIPEYMTDLYQDMMDFLFLFKKNTHTSQNLALYECKNLFITHWGARVTSLINGLHKMVFPYIPIEDHEDFFNSVN